MAQTVSDIAVTVGGDISPLQRELRRGSRSLDRFGKDGRKLGATMAKVGAGVATALAAAGGATYALAKRSAELATRIENLSRVAGTTPEQFQRWSEATRTVGIEQEKLSDILKDVQDKVGDFIQSGGGPMADFFEQIAPKVGVTVEQFRRLSGPDALQLYVESLEKANISQSEMTFYMEAIASDATALLPLLRNNGSEMNRLGNEAQRAGRILSNDMVRNGAALDRTLQDLSSTITTSVNEAILANSEELQALAETISENVIPQIGALIGMLSETVTSLGNVGQAAWAAGQNLLDFMQKRDEANQGGGSGGRRSRRDNRGDGDGFEAPGNPFTFTYGDPSSGSRSSRNPSRQNGGALIAGGGGLDLSGTGIGGDTELSDSGAGGGPTKPSLSPMPTHGSGGSSGGGAGRDWREEFDQFQRQLMTRREALQADYEEQLQQLKEFRDRKVATEEEYNETEARIRSEHEEAMTKLDRRQQNQRLNDARGMFGDLSTLMQSENEKLFKIGKAASMADAVISGYQAAVDAWQKGMKVGGPPVAGAYAAASLAKTGALISQIQSTSLSGTSVGGAPGGSAGAAGGGAQEMNKYVTVDLRGNGLSRDDKQALVSTLNEAIGDGYRLKGMRLA